jgi:WhiB family redox-sensing transcriptional regulator
MTARQLHRVEIAQPEPHTVELRVLVEGLTWQDFARCAEVDPEIFFPEKGQSVNDPSKICRGCEVRTPCLEYALEKGERYGFWGGMSERERRRILRQREEAQGEPQLGERRPERAPKSPKRRVTVSDLETIRARREDGDNLTVIAEDYDVTHGYLSKLLAGHATPVPDPIVDNAPEGSGEAGKVAA